MVTQNQRHRDAEMALEAIKKNAEATSGSPPKEKKEKKKAIGSTPGSSDGGGSGGKSPGTTTGGGSGGDSSGGSLNKQMWFNPQILVGAIVMLVGGIGLFTWSIRSNPDKVQEAAIARSNADIAEATGAFPQGWTPGPASAPTVGQKSAPKPLAPLAMSSLPVKTATAVECPSLGDQAEIDKFWDSQVPQTLEPGQSLRITTGCTLVKANAYATSFYGTDYLLAVFDKKVFNQEKQAYESYYFKCGTYGGYNNANSQCMDFFNTHAGQFVQFGTKSGVIVIN